MLRYHPRLDFILGVVSNVYENKERHSHECLGEEYPAWRKAALDSRHLDFFYMRQYALPTIKNPGQHDHRDATTTIPRSVGRSRRPALHLHRINSIKGISSTATPTSRPRKTNTGSRYSSPMARCGGAARLQSWILWRAAVRAAATIRYSPSNRSS